MSFNPNEDHSISLAEAANITKAYRDANPGAKIGGFFGKDAIQAILDQADCVGLKYYFAIESGQPTLVLCGAKADQDDLYTGSLAEFSNQDPPYSSSPNPLNS
ncbi:MAG: hypothetical protein JXR19_06930 [Bacteroidia bacterium]